MYIIILACTGGIGGWPGQGGASLTYGYAMTAHLAQGMTCRQTFVLGSRHSTGGWAIRKFDDQPLHAFVLNAAHWSFTLLINVSLGIWLRDPFTMYKVFRRDASRRSAHA